MITFSSFLYMFIVGSVQGLFYDFSFSLRFLEVSHVEGSSLTSFRYQALFSFFCNQQASARLVIRRAVEIGGPRFVGCSWFIGLIGLDTELPKINLISTPVCSAFPRVPTSL